MLNLSSVHLPNRSILEASKVSGCDGGLHSRPELSALVTRVGGELAQVMRRRRARTCSMRSAGRRLVPSDGGGATRNSRALAFHAGGPREWHGHVSGPCHSGGPDLIPTYRSAAHEDELSASPRRKCWCGRRNLKLGGEPPTIESLMQLRIDQINCVRS